MYLYECVCFTEGLDPQFFFFLDAYVYVNTYNAHDEKKIF